MNTTFIALIGYYASLYGVNPRVAVAVATVESGMNVNAVGEHGEIGLFQLKPSSVKIKRQLLFNPEVNIREGVKFLAWNQKYCKHKEAATYLVCFNFGIKNAEKVKHPRLFGYYKRVMKAMKKFEEGQKVMVVGLYNNEVDGQATYLGLSREKFQTGKFRILNEYGQVMAIDPERVIDLVEYWKSER